MNKLVFLFVVIAFIQGCSSTGKDKRSGEYKLVWAEEFDCKDKLNSNTWNYESGFLRNFEFQWYQPENAECKDGHLILWGKRETKDNPNYEKGSDDWRKNREKIHYTSGSVNTRGKRNWLYGRFEAKIRIKTEAGLWPAMWFLGKDGEWPSGGEIDLMEYYGGNILANAAWATDDRWHALWDDSRTPVSALGGEDWDEEFHVWRMDWDQEYIKLYVDDRLLNTIDLSQTINSRKSKIRNPFHRPHYMLLSLAIGGTQGGDPSNTEFPTKVEFDYVRVFQK